MHEEGGAGGELGVRRGGEMPARTKQELLPGIQHRIQTAGGKVK